jgi:tetrahydromethanopterin S-methyltransferase subunit G
MSELEKENLEAHVDLCAERYKALESRLTAIEEKVAELHSEMLKGNSGMVKVIIVATGAIVTGLLSTIVTLLMKFPG